MDAQSGRAAAIAVQAPPEQDAHLVIDEAHQRSKAFGVCSDDAPDFSSLAISQLKAVLEENRFLFQHAVPVMETLYGQIANTHSMVLLTSAQGMVLHSMGDNDFLEKANRVALVPGMDWSEKTKGTNAIGTALSAQQAVTVHGDQHFMQRQPGADLLLRADSRPLRPDRRRAGRDRRPPQLPPAHHGAGAHVGADDREPHVREQLPEGRARAFPFASRVSGHPGGGHCRVHARGALSLGQPQRAVPARHVLRRAAGAYLFLAVRAADIGAVRALRRRQPGATPVVPAQRRIGLVPHRDQARRPLGHAHRLAPVRCDGQRHSAQQRTTEAQLSSLQYLDTGDTQVVRGHHTSCARWSTATFR